MKPAPFGLIVLLVPALASAQETYSAPFTAGQVARIDRARIKQNATTCLRRNAAGGATCSQAQACVAYGASGGAGCSPAQARATTPSAEIFADSLAGRQLFFNTHGTRLSELQGQSADDDAAAWCQWWKNDASQAEKNTACAMPTPPLGNGCEVCR